MASPELSVVCKSCGSEVSPYVTECPYCGTRLRKRAPKLERVGDEVRVREGRSDRRRRKAAERRARLAERAVASQDLALRPMATIAVLAASAIVLVVERASNLSVYRPRRDRRPGRRRVVALLRRAVRLRQHRLPVRLRPRDRDLPAGDRAPGRHGRLAAAGDRQRRARDARRRGPRLDLRRRDPVAAGGNGIALGVVCAWLVIRDAERRADPTDEYDQVAVAVVDRGAPAAAAGGRLRLGLGRARRGAGRRRLRARRRPLGQTLSKFTPLTDELHDYMVDHGARQDEVLRRVQEETAAMGEISVMQIAPDQGAFMTLLAKLVGAREAIELGTFTGYSAICIARGLVPGGRLIACELSEEYAEIAGAQPRGAPGSPTGSRSGSGRRSRRSRRCPSARPSTSASSTPTRRATRPTTSGPRAHPARRPDRDRQRARRRPRDRSGRALRSRSRRSAPPTTWSPPTSGSTRRWSRSPTA